MYTNPSKMKTSEILSLENDNWDRMICLREGMFWHLYERSAFLFVKQVKALKPTRRYIKAIGRQVVSVGFPESSLEELCCGHERMVDRPDRVELKSLQAVDLCEFEEWKTGKPSSAPVGAEDMVQLVSPSYSPVEMDVLSFDLAHKTPMDCFLFVDMLQKRLMARG